MEDKVIADNFNIYDIFVRFGPGCIIVGYFYYCYSLFFNGSFNLDFYMKLLIYISLSYMAGCLLRAIVRPFEKKINRHCFGGDPRNVYLSTMRGKKSVLKHEVTRNMAKKIREDIVDRLKITNSSEMEIDHFVFGYMINRLVIDGKSNKNDRINTLAQMCSSFAVTIILCDIIGIITFIVLWFTTKAFTVNEIGALAVGALLSIAGGKSACYLYIHYTQMRFTIVVKQFVVCYERELITDFESNESKQVDAKA